MLIGAMNWRSAHLTGPSPSVTLVTFGGREVTDQSPLRGAHRSPEPDDRRPQRVGDLTPRSPASSSTTASRPPCSATSRTAGCVAVRPHHPGERAAAGPARPAAGRVGALLRPRGRARAWPPTWSGSGRATYLVDYGAIGFADRAMGFETWIGRHPPDRDPRGPRRPRRGGRPRRRRRPRRLVARRHPEPAHRGRPPRPAGRVADGLRHADRLLADPGRAAADRSPTGCSGSRTVTAPDGRRSAACRRHVGAGQLPRDGTEARAHQGATTWPGTSSTPRPSPGPPRSTASSPRCPATPAAPTTRSTPG